MRQRERWLAAVLAGLLTLAGCAAPTPEVTATPEPTPTPTASPAAETLEFALPCYPGAGFHPITGTNRLNLTLAPLLYRGLFALDGSFEARKDLCADYDVSEDGLTWTFRLAEDYFSDGAPLTAAEVISSLNTARKSERYGGRLSNIVGVMGREDTVIVTLYRPNGALPALLDVPIVKETGEALGPLGTGPYFLTETGSGLTLSARDGAEVPRETILLRPVSSSDDLVYAFEARTVSLVDTDLTGTNLPGYSGRQESTDYPTSDLLYVGFQTGSGVFRDQTVRQAAALAFDRSRVAEEVLLGHGTAAALPVHPNSRLYDPAAASALDYDPTRAAELLAGAGWSMDEEGKLARWGNRLTVKFIVNQENIYKVSAATELANSLERLGFSVTLVKLPWDSFITALERGEFDLFLGECILTGDFALDGLLGMEGALNYGAYRDDVTEALLWDYQGAGEETRGQAAGALWEQLARSVPLVPLCFKNGSVLTQWGQIRGLAPTQRNVFFGLESWTVRS